MPTYLEKKKTIMSANISSQRETDYEQDLRLLQSFRETKNIDGLENFVEEIEKKWYSMDKARYFNLVLNTCTLLSSYAFKDYHREISLLQKYAILVLKKSDEMPLGMELKLLLLLPEPPGYPYAEIREEAWPKQRAYRTMLYLHGQQRLHKEIDPDFDFDDMPKRNIAPPLGTSSGSGVAPEHINDPTLRAEYEAAIAQNAQKASIYNWQHKLRQLERMFSPKAEQYIVQAYSTPPFNIEELEQLLETHNIGEENKLKILDSVRKRMTTIRGH